MEESLPQSSIDWKRASLLAAGSALFGLYLVRLDWGAVRDTRSAFPVGIGFLVVVLNLLTGALKYGRWSGLLRRRGIEERGSALEEYLAINAGFFLGLVTPGTSGELTRGAFSGVSSARATSIVGYEKTSDLAVLLLMVAGSFVVQFTNGLASWVASGLILLVSGAAYVLFLRFDKMVTAPVRILLERFGNERHVETARGMYWEFYELLKDRRALVVSLGYSALLWVLPVIQMHLIMAGLGGDVPFKTSAFTFLFPYLIGVLSLIPAGIGAFDMAADAFGGRAIALAGAATELGSLAPLFFRVLVTVPLIAFGYVCQLILNAARKSGSAA
jgi:uncharacterized protein (TIRG00374 family)